MFGSVALIGVALLLEGRGWLATGGDPGGSGGLRRAMRFEVANPDGFEQLLLGLRIHHYRPQPQGTFVYRDVYYDTVELDLLRRGYFFRLRARLEGAGGPRYSVHLEQDRRPPMAAGQRIDLTSDLSDELGNGITAGEWDRAVSQGEGLAAPESLRAVLLQHGVEAGRVGPRLVGELRRERFDVTDKGRTWFDLQHDVWTFHRFLEPAERGSVRYEDITLDTRLTTDDPELLRRVRTMERLARMIHGIRPSARAPHERALRALTAT
jgi:hypothetical protein